MRTIELTIYTYEELNDQAKVKAREWYRQTMDCDWAWHSEWLNSAKTFCFEFGVTLTEWSVGPYSTPTYKTNAENSNFRGRKLSEFNREHMPTGFGADCSFWTTFYDEFKRTGDAKSAFDAALWKGFKDWRDDIENTLEDESVEDAIIANEYEFTEEGNRA